MYRSNAYGLLNIPLHVIPALIMYAYSIYKCGRSLGSIYTRGLTDVQVDMTVSAPVRVTQHEKLTGFINELL